MRLWSTVVIQDHTRPLASALGMNAESVSTPARSASRSALSRSTSVIFALHYLPLPRPLHGRRSPPSGHKDWSDVVEPEVLARSRSSGVATHPLLEEPSNLGD